MPLPYMDQLLEDAFEHPLFLCLMKGRVHGEHPVFGGNEFLPAGLQLFPLTALSKPPTVNCEVETFVSPTYST